MNELALFAGAGGGILGGKLLGWRTVCAVEREPYAAGVLIARQNDGILPPFPIWDDVCTFDGKPWRGIVDVVSGGFPCQDISTAGKGAGLDGARSGLWGEMARIIGEVRPRYAFIENSPVLTLRGLDRVLCDLAAMGFDARWGVVSAADAGAPHLRERVWIVATNTNSDDWTTFSTYTGVIPEGDGSVNESSWIPVITGDCSAGNVSNTYHGRHGFYVQPELVTGRGTSPNPGSNGAVQPLADPACIGRGEERERFASQSSAARIKKIMAEGSVTGLGDSNIDGLQGESIAGIGECEIGTVIEGCSITGTDSEGWSDRGWWETEPDVGRVANGVAARVDRLKAIGNGQVPQAAALAWGLLK